MEPGSGKGGSLWTASSRKAGPKWVCKGLADLSTMSHGSTLFLRKDPLTDLSCFHP
jgi:hypothetical protein